jgi:hypothetical protein
VKFSNIEGPMVLQNVYQAVHKSGKLSDLAFEGYIRDWYYETVSLGLGDQLKNKHFKLLKVFSDITSQQGIWEGWLGDTLETRVNRASNQQIGSYKNIDNGKLYIGRNLKWLTLAIRNTFWGRYDSGTQYRPFRIYGYQLDIHDRGRR